MYKCGDCKQEKETIHDDKYGRICRECWYKNEKRQS